MSELGNWKTGKNVIIGGLLTVVTAVVGKKVKDRMEEKGSEVVVETDKYKVSRKK